MEAKMNKLLLIVLPICTLLAGSIGMFRFLEGPPPEVEKENIRLHFDSLIETGHYLEALGFVVWGTASSILLLIALMITMHLWGKIRS